jgi:hypothetical protein
MSKLPKQMSATIGMQKKINKLMGFGGSKKRKAQVGSKMRNRKT